MSSPVISTSLITSGSMSGTTENFVEVTNGCFARKIGWDSSPWYRLRVGIRYRVTYDANQPVPTDTPRMGLGFCNGTENIPGSPYTQMAMGAFWYDPTPSVAIDNNPYWDIYSSTTVCVNTATMITGSTLVNRGVALANHCYVSAATGSAGIMMVDLVKSGAPTIVNGIFNGAIGIFFRNLTSVVHEYVSTSNFISLLETPSPTAAKAGYGYGVTSPYTLDWGTFGYPDSIFVWNQRSYPKIQIADIYIVKLSV